jgi:hypothetical protein
MASNAFVRSLGPIGEVPGIELLGVELLGPAVMFSLPQALTASTSKARRAVDRLLLHVLSCGCSCVPAVVEDLADARGERTGFPVPALLTVTA